MGNSQDLKCPMCNSGDYTYYGEEDKWKCEDCGDEE
mgnify:CR=1 FL=1